MLSVLWKPENRGWLHRLHGVSEAMQHAISSHHIRMKREVRSFFLHPFTTRSNSTTVHFEGLQNACERNNRWRPPRYLRVRTCDVVELEHGGFSSQESEDLNL